MLVGGVARHVAGVHDVVEDDEPPVLVSARLGVKAEVGVQGVGRREVSDRAVRVDLDLGRSEGDDVAVDHSEIGSIGAVDRQRRSDRSRQQGQKEDQRRNRPAQERCRIPAGHGSAVH